MKSLFVHDPADLHAAIPGGVQLCSQEFLAIIRQASSETRLLPVTVTHAFLWRLKRKLGLGGYLSYNPEEARTLFLGAISFAPTHIFLNRSALVRLGPIASEVFPNASLVIMSHGNQSGDDLYEVAGPGGRRSTGLAHVAGAWRIGLDLALESRFRHRHVHGVCVMSEEEAVLERWLGARRVVVLPRVFTADALAPVPVPGRIGYVGTLDHTPNRLALEAVCMELARQGAHGIELRLVGGPAHVAGEFAARFPFVRAVGRIDDASLRAEAATWSVFINPIFWLSRGASMKLALALGWGLPVVTSRSGARGYEWREGGPCITDDTPANFVRTTLSLLRDPAKLGELRAACTRAAATGPTVAELAGRLRTTFPDTP